MLKNKITGFVATIITIIAADFTPTDAKAATINFDGLVAYTPFTSDTQADFTVTSISGNWNVWPFGNPGNAIFFGLPTIAELAVTHAGALFTFSSIDFSSSIEDFTYTFKGLRSG